MPSSYGAQNVAASTAGPGSGRGSAGGAPARGKGPRAPRRGPGGRSGKAGAPPVREVRRPGFWATMPRWLKLLICVGAAVLVVAALLGAAAWDLWLRYDDAADIQGTWRSSAGATMVITQDKLQLSDSVAYDYTIDTRNKTIDFSFGNATGHASYRFNADRTQLVLDEVDDTNYLMVLGIVADRDLEAGTTGDGVSVLTREGAWQDVTGGQEPSGSSGETDEGSEEDASSNG